MIVVCLLDNLSSHLLSKGTVLHAAASATPNIAGHGRSYVLLEVGDLGPPVITASGGALNTCPLASPGCLPQGPGDHYMSWQANSLRDDSQESQCMQLMAPTYL